MFFPTWAMGRLDLGEPREQMRQQNGGGSNELRWGEGYRHIEAAVTSFSQGGGVGLGLVAIRFMRGGGRRTRGRTWSVRWFSRMGLRDHLRPDIALNCN